MAAAKAAAEQVLPPAIAPTDYSRWSNPRPLTAANQASAAAAEQEKAASEAAAAAKAKFKETIEAAKAQSDSKAENREAPQ